MQKINVFSYLIEYSLQIALVPVPTNARFGPDHNIRLLLFSLIWFISHFWYRYLMESPYQVCCAHDSVAG